MVQFCELFLHFILPFSQADSVSVFLFDLFWRGAAVESSFGFVEAVGVDEAGVEVAFVFIVGEIVVKIGLAVQHGQQYCYNL